MAPSTWIRIECHEDHFEFGYSFTRVFYDVKREFLVGIPKF